MLLLEKKLTDAAPLIVDLTKQQGPLTSAVKPGAGATLAVELSLDNGRSYAAWVPGATVTAAANATTTEGQTPTHVKVTQTVASTESWVVISK